jgi:chromosome segregation ATPase
MTTRRQRRGNLSAMCAEKRQAIDQYPARRFPIQHEIQRLEEELNAFNERIEELENEGHRSHAMEVLKANALDFARQIDELRCVLVEPAPKDALSAAKRDVSLSTRYGHAENRSTLRRK